jgi:hypothetical protein
MTFSPIQEPDPGNTFRLQQTGRIDVDQVEAEQFAAALAAAMTAIIAQVKSPQSKAKDAN